VLRVAAVSVAVVKPGRPSEGRGKGRRGKGRPLPDLLSTCYGYPRSTNNGRCDAVCGAAIAGGATDCQCEGLSLAANGLDCAPRSLELSQGGNGQMVAPLLVRRFVVVAGGRLRLVLPLYLGARSSAIFTLVQVWGEGEGEGEGGG
jgi:hypothetical protein